MTWWAGHSQTEPRRCGLSRGPCKHCVITRSPESWGQCPQGTCSHLLKPLRPRAPGPALSPGPPRPLLLYSSSEYCSTSPAEVRVISSKGNQEPHAKCLDSQQQALYLHYHDEKEMAIKRESYRIFCKSNKKTYYESNYIDILLSFINGRLNASQTKSKRSQNGHVIM